MWYYGNEVCYRSTLDAEVEMSGAGWMYRITKNTHTHTHTFVLDHVRCLRCFKSHVALNVLQKKQSSVRPRLRFCRSIFQCFYFFRTQSSSYSVPQFDPVDSWNCIVTGFWCGSLLSTQTSWELIYFWAAVVFPSSSFFFCGLAHSQPCGACSVCSGLTDLNLRDAERQGLHNKGVGAFWNAF